MSKDEQIELAEFLDELTSYMCEADCDMSEQGSQFLSEIRTWIIKLDPTFKEETEDYEES